MGSIISRIFGSPKMPDTSKAMAAQTQAMEKQSALLEKQEARLEEQEKTAQRQASGAARARRRGRGSYRLLLSPSRSNAATGIKGSGTTLGA